MSEPADLTVSELFGPTFQGEGPNAGRRAMFVRLGRCNLDCAWCDTPYTWDWKGKIGPPQDPSALRRMTILDVLQTLNDLCDQQRTGLPSLTVITGGEPMVQRALLPLCDMLTSRGTVEIETNGTIEPGAALSAYAHYNVSPKLAHSGVPRAKAINEEALTTFACLADAGRARFKFVVREAADLMEVRDLCNDIGIPPDTVWIMPEGRSSEQIHDGLRKLADDVLAAGYNLTGRLHVTLWEDKRAV
jgi:7-carboxy-7-deazaguanine synthase